ncbi:hypothetical protein [Ferrimonas pelagia]|uniref:Uncharacterized protein n=1 Tax=Ferrimonas pelagia TaxID=1177826 RepID=A0ABP9EIU3_9GAMM
MWIMLLATGLNVLGLTMSLAQPGSWWLVVLALGVLLSLEPWLQQLNGTGWVGIIRRQKRSV